MVKCCLCLPDTDEFQCVDDLEAHIAAEHFDCVPFECEKCKFSKFPTEFAIKRHFEEDHRMSEYYIRYKVSRQTTEKLCKVRECLQRSCASVGIELPNFSNFSQLNRLFDNNQPASGSSSVRTSTVTPNHVEADNSLLKSGEDLVLPNSLCDFNKCNMKSEENAFNCLNNDSNTDVASAALAAFIRSAGVNTDNFLNAGDSNNNKTTDGQLAEENFNSFYSKLLTPMNSYCQNNDNYSKVNAIGEITDNIDDPQNQAQQLLRRIESHITTQNNNLLMASKRKRRRQVVKRFAVTPKLKKRFYLLQNGLDSMDSTSSLSSATFHQNNELNSTNDYFDLSLVSNGMESNTNGNAILKVNEIQCQQCKEMVTNRATSLNYHVNMKHLKFPLFVCKGCDKKFLWQRTTIVTHVQRYHNGDESLIEDNSGQYMSSINLRRKTFFPPKFALATAAAAAAAAASANNSEDVDANCEDGALNSPSTSIQGFPLNFGAGNSGDSCEFHHDENSCVKGELADNYVENVGLDENADIGSLISDDALADVDASGLVENGIGQRKNSGIKLKCGECQKMILANKQWILLNHINSEHMHLPLFECRACKQVFTKYLRSYVFMHVKKYHDGNEDLVIDNRPIFLERLQQKCFEFFKVRLSN